ncbi:hypothetical protein DL96DRAFT_1684390 [Flagelloscypha sp. PMI_526]|nr:hypothetical protein DL96DRAFT_1684390 [Flagelloscypha sp. PMI_526]
MYQNFMYNSVAHRGFPYTVEPQRASNKTNQPTFWANIRDYQDLVGPDIAHRSMTAPSTEWSICTQTRYHITNNFRILHDRIFNVPDGMTVRGGKQMFAVRAMGTVTLTSRLDNGSPKKIKIHVLFCPKFPTNIFSVSAFSRTGATVTTVAGQIIIIRDVTGETILLGHRKEGRYILSNVSVYKVRERHRKSRPPNQFPGESHRNRTSVGTHGARQQRDAMRATENMREPLRLEHQRRESARRQLAKLSQASKPEHHAFARAWKISYTMETESNSSKIEPWLAVSDRTFKWVRDMRQLGRVSSPSQRSRPASPGRAALRAKFVTRGRAHARWHYNIEASRETTDKEGVLGPDLGPNNSPSVSLLAAPHASSS